MVHDHASIELELLRVFDHLYRERHLTRASRLAGLSQPATSRALARLREIIGDPLFVKAPRGMVPTSRADALAPEVRHILERTAQLLRPPELDPRTLERAFVIGSVDFVEADILPRLAALLEREAPKVSVISRPMPSDAAQQLAEGRLDLVVGVRPTLPSECMVQHLFDDDFTCAVREGHPVVRDALPLARFVELSHVLIAPRGEPGSPVDTLLARRGHARHVAVRTFTFLAAPLVVAESDLVLTGPKRILVPMASRHGLALFEPPVELRAFSIAQAWHPRVQEDPVHAWFRGMVRRAAQPAPSAAKPKAVVKSAKNAVKSAKNAVKTDAAHDRRSAPRKSSTKVRPQASARRGTLRPPD